MTSEEMRERVLKYEHDAKEATSNHAFWHFRTRCQIWLAAAEICEQLDRAAQPQEEKK